MREMEVFNMLDFSHEEERKVVKKRRPRRRSYTCNYCRYESTRQYNVIRHEERIHTIKQTPRTCCDMVLQTKGEYYLHCEQFHPEKRLNAIVSRTKYKILADIRVQKTSGHLDRQRRRRCKRRRRRTFDDPDEEEDEDEEEEEERCVEKNRTYVSHRRRYSERMRQKGMETRAKSELTFQCSISYSELDRENIPLACFLNDRTLRKACYSSTPVATVNPSKEAAICKDDVRSTKNHDDPRESISDTTMVSPIAENTMISPKRFWKKEVKREYSTRHVEEEDTGSALDSLDSSRRWTSLSESSSSSFIGELPTKKLLLRRFMATMNFEIEKTSQQRATTMPLQERHTNAVTTPLSQRSVKRYQHYFIPTSTSSSYTTIDKENIPNFEMEERVKVELDNNISLPFVTKLHREFLSSIDFDNL